MKTPAYGWYEPSVYSHRHGVAKQKRRPYIRFILLIGLVINGAVFAASSQLGGQSDSVEATGQNQVANIEEVSLPPQLSTSQVPPESIGLVDPQLQTILQNWSNSHQKQDWSIVVKGLGDDNRYASVRGDSWYVPASLYKLLITYPLFQKYELSTLESQKITVGKEQKSVKSCVEAMLKWSDNDCGEALGKSLGWYHIDSALQKAGLKQTQLNRKDAMFSNASDVNMFLEGLYDSKLFSGEERKFILDNMQQGSWRKGIPSACTGCVVANKTGDLANVRHDSAIVTYNGGAYALTIMTSGAGYGDIAKIAGQIHDHIVATRP